jgi:GWxTD domain-containing protein
MKKLVFFVLISLPAIFFSQNKLNFDFDYARFRYDSLQDYVEFYYAFPQNELTLNKTNKGFIVKAVLHIELKDSSTGKIAYNRDWEINNSVKDTSALSLNRNLIGVIKFIVNKGVYNCIVKGRDAVDSTRNKTINEIIRVNPFGIDNNISISDIQVATNIIQEDADTSSTFYKNTLEVIPNPLIVYGEGMPVLFYYTEMYHIKSNNPESKLKIKTYLLNSRGESVIEKSKEVSRGAESRVEVGTLKITNFPTDTYVLIIDAIDSTNNFGVSSSKKVFIYNPSVVDSSGKNIASTGLLSSEYSILNNEECDDLFDKSKYVATNQESSQYKKLSTVESKREFLFQFWRKRDKNPYTPENETKNEYMERVRLSNERYGTLNRKGMKTDRGRVFIEYGEPDEIERYPNGVDKKPYEIWQYHQIEGGVIFIFGDVSGFSDYQLLHSTKRGEISDSNWESRITTN